MPKSSGIYIGGGKETAASFAKRKALASPRSAKEWAAVPKAIRENAFWSAKVTHAKHVAELKAACKEALVGGRRKVRDLHSQTWTPAELEQEAGGAAGGGEERMFD